MSDEEFWNAWNRPGEAGQRNAMLRPSGQIEDVATGAAPFMDAAPAGSKMAMDAASAADETIAASGQTDQAARLDDDVDVVRVAAGNRPIRAVDGSASGPTMQQPAGSALSSRRDPPRSATGTAAAIPVSYLQSTTPVPFKDDKGNPVLDDKGGQMMMPSDADPHFFVDAGQIFGSAGLANFRQGGPWDLQRVGPDRTFVKDFTNYSTVAIGLYGAAAGIPLDTLLAIEDSYAASHSDFGSAERDSKYTHLRAENVWNTRFGYELYSSGRIGPSPTGSEILKNLPQP
jgi:hypothetical protein